MFGLLLMLGSLATSVYGQIAQGRAANKAAKSQAAAAEATAQQQEFNAGVADAQARDAVAVGDDQVARLRTSVRGLIGTQRAGYAGQGVSVDTGSAADVQADAQALSEADVRTIRANAQRQAWGFRVDAANYRKNADVARKGGVVALKEGSAAQTASYIGAGATVLGGASLLSQRYGWGQPKLGVVDPAATRTKALNAGRGYQGDALTLKDAA
jgi:hypothetical protein